MFDSTDRKPIVHTQTVDLSATGAAIVSERGDLLGSVVNLLLARPAPAAEGAPKVLKARARVVSTVRSPGMQHYRHGLSFIRAPGDELDAIELFLKTAAGSAPTARPTIGAARSGAQFDGGAAASHVQSQESIHLGVSAALATTHRRLMDLASRLDRTRPAYPRGYSIVGVPEFTGLAWEKGNLEFRMKEITPGRNLYEHVELRFRLSGGTQIRVAREYPAAEKLEQLLRDCDIRFQAEGAWNARGSLVSTTFEFPCEVNASLAVTGRYDTGHVLLRAQNVSGFGLIEQLLAPQAIDRDSLEELSAFVLGESPVLGPLLLRGA